MLITHDNKAHEQAVALSEGQRHAECTAAKQRFEAGEIAFPSYDATVRDSYIAHYRRVITSCETHGLHAASGPARDGLRDLGASA